MLNTIESSIIPPKPIQYKPVYDVANLVLAIQKAAQEFHDRWNGILGMRSISVVRPEHWTRVKALSRRLGIFKIDEYDTLRPVADLIRLLQIHVSQFLSNPFTWDPMEPHDDSTDKIESIDAIKKEVFKKLHDLSRQRILEERVGGWKEAYYHRGPGSTWSRARDIITIYGEAVPVPNVMPESEANLFLFQIRELIFEAVKTVGGKLKGWEQ
ncbi:MAG: hypothetical protein AB1656_12435 [Candidatus Omnitrophota bacterium]